MPFATDTSAYLTYRYAKMKSVGCAALILLVSSAAAVEDNTALIQGAAHVELHQQEQFSIDPVQDLVKRAVQVAGGLWGPEAVTDTAKDVQTFLAKIGEGSVEETLPNALAEFLANAAHRVVNPVSSVTKDQATDMIQRIRGQVNGPELLQMLKMAVSAQKTQQLFRSFKTEGGQHAVKNAMEIADTMLGKTANLPTTVDGRLNQFAELTVDSLEGKIEKWMSEFAAKSARQQILKMKPEGAEFNEETTSNAPIARFMRESVKSRPSAGVETTSLAPRNLAEYAVEDEAEDEVDASRPAPAPAPDVDQEAIRSEVYGQRKGLQDAQAPAPAPEQDDELWTDKPRTKPLHRKHPNGKKHHKHQQHAKSKFDQKKAGDAPSWWR